MPGCLCKPLPAASLRDTCRASSALFRLDWPVMHNTKQRNQSKPTLWLPPTHMVADTGPVRLTHEKCTKIGNPTRKFFQTISHLIDGGTGAQNSCTKICTRLPQVLLLVEKTTSTSVIQAARHPLKPELVRSPKLAPPADGARTPICRHPLDDLAELPPFPLPSPSPNAEALGTVRTPALGFSCAPPLAPPPLSFCSRDLSVGSWRYLHGSPFRSNRHPPRRPNRSTEAEQSLHSCAHVWRHALLFHEVRPVPCECRRAPVHQRQYRRQSLPRWEPPLLAIRRSPGSCQLDLAERAAS